MLAQLIFSNPLAFLLVMTALIISIAIHEFAHAYSADKLGDPTARYLGRVTLNPLAHLDPLGTLLLIVAGFGWGKPVPFDPAYLENPKRDAAIIAFAGPLSNFIIALLLSLVSFLINPVPQLLSVFLYITVFYNLVLGLFNLIPIHPLDGFKVVNGLLPYELSIQWQQTANLGWIVLLLLIFTDVIGSILLPVISVVMGFLGF